MKNFEEINALINKNFELGFQASALLRELNRTWNMDLIKDIDAIHAKQDEIHNTIVKMRGEN